MIEVNIVQGNEGIVNITGVETLTVLTNRVARGENLACFMRAQSFSEFPHRNSFGRGRTRDSDRQSPGHDRSRSRTPTHRSPARQLDDVALPRRRRPANHWDRDSDGNALAEMASGGVAGAGASHGTASCLAVMSAITKVRRAHARQRVLLRIAASTGASPEPDLPPPPARAAVAAVARGARARRAAAPARRRAGATGAAQPADVSPRAIPHGAVPFPAQPPAPKPGRIA